MNKELPCEIMNDLLPTYIDGLTSEVTNQAIQLHLDNCADCLKTFQNMNVSENRADYIKDLDYLRKIRMQARKSIVVTIFLCVLFFSGIHAGTFIWRALIGIEAAPYDMQYSMLVKDNVLNVQGKIISNYYGQENAYSRIRFEENGNTVVVRIGRVVKSRFHQDSYFQTSYESVENIEKVYIAVGDSMFIAYDDGLNISPSVALIADTIVDGVFLQERDWQLKAGISHWLEIDDRELYFAYDDLENPTNIVIGINTIQKQALVNRKMKAMTYILLAILDNCESISWVYGVPDDWDVSKTDYESMNTVTRQAASDLLKKNIQDFRDNAIDLQKLLFRVY